MHSQTLKYLFVYGSLRRGRPVVSIDWLISLTVPGLRNQAECARN